MRIVFMGTPAFALPSLNALTEAGHTIAAVFTQPDRPKGRGNKVVMPPVKEWALQRGIPVYQPQKIRLESVDTLRELRPDLCVTAAFGQLLSQELLDIPRLGTVNVHASLLPRHRGSAPIAWAILQGDEEIGVTIMHTVRALDAGPMYLKRAVPRDPAMTCGEATELLAELGAKLLAEALPGIEDGSLAPVPQDEALMTYEPMLDKSLSAVDWTQSAQAVVCRIHALNPWPACVLPTAEGPLKLLRARAAAGQGQPGTLLAADAKSGLVIACGEGAVEITELQAPGGKALRSADYLRGHKVTLAE